MSGKRGMWKGKEHRHRNGKYAGLDRYAVLHFGWMHDRIKYGKAPCTDFPPTREGYIEFCKELGPIPKRMRRPSVGRIDHYLGYVRGNIHWQSYNKNSAIRRANQHRFENFDKPSTSAYIAEEDIPF
jgi:hypothetical protein